MSAAHDSAVRRLDIQGLRGLAVIPGFIYHMTDRLPGAVIFIDMFFAVSGYLITVRLIELAQTRTMRGYYLEFYRFRVRRLFPASITVIAATTLLAWALFVPSRAHHVTGDAVASLLFWANIRYASEGTDYLHRGDSTTPLLPFWSLSMEEQFYLLWPVLVLVLVWWGARRGRQRSALASASAAILVLSFGYGFWFTRSHHVAAYYDTPSRAWDFAVGMLLAVYAMRGRLSHGADSADHADHADNAGAVMRVMPALRSARDLLNRHATLVSWAGGLLFFLAVFVTPVDHGFPVPWGGVGVVGAALVIFAGIDQRPRNWMLGNRLSVKLGDLSYAIYLVHFPVLIFAASYLAANKATLYTFDVVATAGLAVFLYYFVEEPGRRGFRATVAWVRAGRHRPAVNAVALLATAATILFAVGPKGPAPLIDAASPVTTGTTGTTGYPGSPLDPATPTTMPTTTPMPPSPTSSPLHHYDDPLLVDPTPELGSELARSLSLTAWPTVSNGARIDNLSSYLGACDAVEPLRPPCTAAPQGGTSAGKVALAWGDSMMLAYWPMLKAALQAQGWTLVMLARKDCKAALLPDQVVDHADCISYATYEKTLRKWHPALVLVTTNAPTFLTSTPLRGRVPRPIARASATYAQGMRAILDLAHHGGARTLLLSPPPWTDAAHQPGNCLVAGSSPQRCIYSPDRSWIALNKLDRGVARDTGATYADLLPFFCVGTTCPAVVGHLVVHADNAHLTPEYAALLAPSFEAYLLREGLLR